MEVLAILLVDLGEEKKAAQPRQTKLAAGARALVPLEPLARPTTDYPDRTAARRLLSYIYLQGKFSRAVVERVEAVGDLGRSPTRCDVTGRRLRSSSDSRSSYREKWLPVHLYDLPWSSWVSKLCDRRARPRGGEPSRELATCRFSARGKGQLQDPP